MNIKCFGVEPNPRLDLKLRARFDKAEHKRDQKRREAKKALASSGPKQEDPGLVVARSRLSFHTKGNGTLLPELPEKPSVRRRLLGR